MLFSCGIWEYKIQLKKINVFYAFPESKIKHNYHYIYIKKIKIGIKNELSSRGGGIVEPTKSSLLVWRSNQSRYAAYTSNGLS